MWRVFPSTSQTLLREAISPSPLQTPALNTVMGIYWRPCYRYLKLRFGASHEHSEDLVQGFFAALIEQSILSRYDANRGPFRPYLRSCLDQFVLKEFERQRAVKRGQGFRLMPLDPTLAVPSLDATPEEIFRREWQREMFELAVEDLRQLCQATDRRVRYELFAAYDLAGEPRARYHELAAVHGLPVTTVTNHLAWARRELRRLLQDRLCSTVPRERDRRNEMRSLLAGRGT